MLQWPGARGRLATAGADSKFVLLARGAAEIQRPCPSSGPAGVVGVVAGVVARAPPPSTIQPEGAVGRGRGSCGHRAARGGDRPGNPRFTIGRTCHDARPEAPPGRRDSAGADGICADTGADHANANANTRPHGVTGGIHQCAPEHGSRGRGDGSGSHHCSYRLHCHDRLSVSARAEPRRVRRRRGCGLDLAGKKERSAGDLAARGDMRRQHRVNPDHHRLDL